MILKKMECPSCGADIIVKPNVEFAICDYCGSQVVVETNAKTIVYRDEAKLRELELQEQERRRREEQRQAEAQRDTVLKTLSILTSDEAGTALKSVGKLAMRFLKNGL